MSNISPRFAKYPFFEAAKEALAENNEFDQLSEEVLDRACARIINGVADGKTGHIDEEGNETTAGIDICENTELELLSYPAARILVSILNDHRIINRYARAEADTALERFKEDLETAEEYADEDPVLAQARGVTSYITREEVLAEFNLNLTETTPETEFYRTYCYTLFENASEADLIQLGTTVFGIEESNLEGAGLSEKSPDQLYSFFTSRSPKTGVVPTAYRMDFVPFIKIASRIKDGDGWRLSHRGVSDGTLILFEDDVHELIKEAVFQRIRNDLPYSINAELKEKLGDTVEVIKENINDEMFSYEIDRVEEGVFPPLITHLVERFHSHDATHEERFSLACFLVNVGMDTEEIIDFLGVRGTPGEGPSRYQVNHIRTSGEGGEPYTCPTYATVESWGIEWKKDALEAKVKHPLTYYKIKLKQLDEDEEDKTDEPEVVEETPANGEPVVLEEVKPEEIPEDAGPSPEEVAKDFQQDD